MPLISLYRKRSLNVSWRNPVFNPGSKTCFLHLAVFCYFLLFYFIFFNLILHTYFMLNNIYFFILNVVIIEISFKLNKFYNLIWKKLPYQLFLSIYATEIYFYVI